MARGAISVDLSSPNENKRRKKIVNTSKEDKLELAKKAQLKSQIEARDRAEKRKKATNKRAEKRKRDGASDAEEPNTKKKKTEGRIIDFSERDLVHVQHLFNTQIVNFGCLGVMGVVCGYDASFCPVLVYPILTGPPPDTPVSVYRRKYILGVGKQSSVFTGIKQAFGELYPEYPADRVYDWKLWKWNKKLYKAVTVNVAVDPSVLSQTLYSSKSFGGTKHLPAVKITDDLASARKMECAIEVSRYIKSLPESIKSTFPPDYRTITFDDIREMLKAIEEQESNEKESEKKVSKAVASSNIVQELFDQIEKEKTSGDSSEEGEYSSDEE